MNKNLTKNLALLKEKAYQYRYELTLAGIAVGGTALLIVAKKSASPAKVLGTVSDWEPYDLYEFCAKPEYKADLLPKLTEFLADYEVTDIFTIEI
jgi:hypothetical protein